MKKSCLSIENIPPHLLIEFEKNKNNFCEKNSKFAPWLESKCFDDDFREQLIRVWTGSRYVTDLCQRQAELFKQLADSGLFQRTYNEGELAQGIKQCVTEAKNEEHLNKLLRYCRSREMLRIVWRDLSCLSDLIETTRDISNLADISIQLALDYHHGQLSSIHGTPAAAVDGVFVEQKMLVIGMGKLGAFELNLSSDIDLIFSYPKGGNTIDCETIGKFAESCDSQQATHTASSRELKYIDNHEFFTRLGQKVIQSLDKITAEGFVFRVDMRLRPYGESGALVLSFDAMEEYYQDQGRDWERYAMIKARVVAGDPGEADELMTLLRPFIYRRYIDFSVIESLRSMKRMIMQEVKRRRLEQDIKLGPGGIRDIEFIAQSFQLIRGGRETQFQQRSLLKVLTALAEKKHFPQKTIDELVSAYFFLRNTEHVLQAFNDQQTQALPVDDYPRSIVAFSMGYESWELFLAALAQHRDQVSQCFQGIIAEAQEETVTQDPVDGRWRKLWLETPDEEVAVALLEVKGHESAREVFNRLDQLKVAPIVARLQAVGRERLDRFMPMLLSAVSKAERPSATLLRLFPLVDSVLRRSAYLVLLTENPGALKQLIILCASSPWIATQLAKHPALLDELLDTRTLYLVPEKVQLRSELQQQMLRIPWDDLEGHMDGLRYFKQAHQLHVSAAEVTGQLDVMKVSDYLTMIAEVILEHVVDVAWHFLVEKHGAPKGMEGEPTAKDTDHKGFIIVGYGKLGGIELGHSSDLDLVFIHNAPTDQFTDGDKPLDNSVFFTRLGQRIIHILTAQTPMGGLYEVDMRLRPSGESGLLVTSLKAFDDYQQGKAWTWEHQAIVRARVVAGDKNLAQSFESIRRSVLRHSRDKANLRDEVVQMRQKMRDHLLPKGLESREPPIFHLKHGTGAIVDIEFMVQYAVLAWADKYPALADYSDNIRILDSLQQQGLFSEDQSQALIDAYKAYRSHAHRLSLLEQPSEVLAKDYEQYRQAVIAKWSELMN